MTRITGQDAEELVEFYKLIFDQKNYVFYDGLLGLYHLNIVGIRSPSREPGHFDDSLLVLYQGHNASWIVDQYEITTDPGLQYMKRPIHPRGCAILAQGQFVDAYAIGLHRGAYKALVQVGPVTVHRDNNRDRLLDFATEDSPGAPTQTGMFGINIHRRQGEDDLVRGASAGCQVFRYRSEFEEFMATCQQSRSRRKNRFTYTLINETVISEAWSDHATFKVLP